MGGAHSPPRRGGVARSAGVVSSAKRCAGLTTPSAPLRWLRGILLMAQPPLLCEEGNAHSTYQSARVLPEDGLWHQCMDTLGAVDDLRHDQIHRGAGKHIRIFAADSFHVDDPIE